MNLSSREHTKSPAPADLPSGWCEVARGLRWRRPLRDGYASVALDFDSAPGARAYYVQISRIGGESSYFRRVGLGVAFATACSAVAEQAAIKLPPAATPLRRLSERQCA